MKSADWPFAAKDQTWQNRFFAQMPGQNLVHACRCLNLSTAKWFDPRQNSGRAPGMTADDIVWMSQSVNEVDLVLECFQRGKRRAQFERRTIALRPSFRWMNAVAKEHERESLWRCLRSFSPEQSGRFQPRQCDAGAKSIQNDSTCDTWFTRCCHEVCLS